MKTELFDFGKTSQLKVSAEIQYIDDKTVLTARISGNISEIDFPSISGVPERKNGLWNIGCFEIFVSDKDNSYTEYNFGFDHNYEMLAFSNYRQALNSPSIPNPPKIATEFGANLFTQRVELSENIVLDNLFSVTAAVKLKNGSFLYFANKHCGDAADFHLACARDLKLSQV